MEKVFDDVLDRGEQILWVAKPDKKRYIGNFAALMLMMFLPVIILLSVLCIADVEVEDGGSLIYTLIIFAGMGVLVTVVGLILTVVQYKNTYYAYSAKRILVRKGIIGVDYKMLDFKSMGAVAVNVSVLDKLFKRNTGTISFGSPSAQIVSTGSKNGYVNPYNFAHIVSPYETSRQIREVIDQTNSGEAK